MRLLITTLSLLLVTSMAFGQHTKVIITGFVEDSTGQALEGATTVLLRAQDSVLEAFTLAGKDGQFKLTDVKPDRYLLQITYVGYGSFQRVVEVDGSKTTLDLGRINLGFSGINLEEVTVQEEFMPILIKEDTIEYNAGAYRTTPNATVEDLLKQMPGIEVDQDGNVKAQGEDVKQVLVDGKEFFGKDPKMATKNLPADAVDKVQVFDKKSEEAEFSGVDDGKEEKAINLKLKEDKKQGIFGTAEAGYGLPDYYRGKLSANRFSPTLQLSVLGLGNNINEQGFSYGDYRTFTGGSSFTMSGRPGRWTLNSSGIPLMYGGSDGLGRTWAGGANFNLDISPNTKFSSFYFYNNNHLLLEKTVNRTNILQDGSFETRSGDTTVSDNIGHRAQAKLEHDFDSTQNIIITGIFNMGETWSDQRGNERTFLPNDVLQNAAMDQYNSNGKSTSWNTELVYRKRFKKKGRTLTIRGGAGDEVTDTEAEVFNRSRFFDPGGVLIHADTIDQLQETDAGHFNYNGRLTYTEPLVKNHYLSLAVHRNSYTRNNKKTFYDFNPDPEINDDLGNEFEQIYRADAIGLNYRVDEDKLTLNAGVDYQHSILVGNIISQDTSLSRSFDFLLPSLWAEYDFDDANTLDVYYNGSVIEPSLEELQPVIENDDPLRIHRGNPNLRPEYEHYLSLHFRSIDRFNFQYFFANISGRYNLNPIVTVTEIDSLYRQITTSANATNDWSVNDYLSYTTPVKSLKIEVRTGQTASYSKSPYFINGANDEATRFRNSLSLHISNRKKDKVEVSVGGRWTFTNVKYEVNEQLDQVYQSYSINADLQVNFPADFILESDFDQTHYSQEAFGAAMVLSMWDASLSKGFWNNRLTIEFEVKDMLNQNIGLERTSNLNYIEESRTNNIGRLFMINAVYKLSKFAGR